MNGRSFAAAQDDKPERDVRAAVLVWAQPQQELVFRDVDQGCYFEYSAMPRAGVTAQLPSSQFASSCDGALSSVSG